MSIPELLATLATTQKALVKAMQDEYYCDDVEPPPEAFGWSEDALRQFMESGGDTKPAGSADTPPATSATSRSPPLATALDVSDAPSIGPLGRPIILCLGDSNVQFGSHVINLPTADVGSSKHKASLSVTTDPVASEFLRGTETDNPGIEHGPGWTALLSRDFGWRTSADVLNRGYSGMNSAMLRADLAELLATVRTGDVVGVVLMIGANDAVADGEPTHVPVAQFKDNLSAILAALKAACPKAKTIMIGVPPVDEEKWKETAKKLTSSRKSGAERSAARNLEYNQAAEAIAKANADKWFDLTYKLKYEFANAMMELQNPHRDGLHFTRAVNVFVYRKLNGLLDELGLSASKMPRHRPATLAAAYPHFADDDGQMKKYVPKKKPP